MSVYFLLVPVVLLILAATLIAISARDRKRNPLNAPLLDSLAIVTSALAPEGAVLVRGELWLARSNNHSFIPNGARCTVVGLNDHLLLIKELNT